MQRNTRTTVATALALALVLPACQSTGSGDNRSVLSRVGDTFSSEDTRNLTPAEQRLREDNRVFNETIFGGAATGAIQGAIIGGIIGLLASNQSKRSKDGRKKKNNTGKNVARGAAIGAGVGAVAGTLDGYLVAVRQEAARKKVREIEVVADQVEAENARIERSIENMDLVIAQTRRDIDRARAEHAAGRMSLAELKDRETRARRNVDAMDDLMASIEDRNNQYDDVTDKIKRDGVNTAKVDRDIQDTKRLLAQKQQERDLLVEDLNKGTVL